MNASAPDWNLYKDLQRKLATAERELKEAREALKELLTHIQSGCAAHTCRLPCHLIDEANAALSPTKAGTNGGKDHG